MSMTHAVIFDLFDTLVYLTNPIIDEARHAIALRAGVDPDAWAALWRGNVVDRMVGMLGSIEDEIRATLRQLGADPSPGMLAELRELQLDGWAGAVTVYPETIPLLTTLRQRDLKLGLVSNCSADAGATVARIGLASHFDAIVFSCDVGLMKPDPAIYQRTCAALRVTPSESMFVADGAFGELDAARALGMLTVKVEQPNQSGDFGSSTSFDHRVDRLGQILAILEQTSC
jgi:putative hydrolase of the HAD superfamily